MWEAFKDWERSNPRTTWLLIAVPMVLLLSRFTSLNHPLWFALVSSFPLGVIGWVAAKRDDEESERRAAEARRREVSDALAWAKFQRGEWR